MVDVIALSYPQMWVLSRHISFFMASTRKSTCHILTYILSYSYHRVNAMIASSLTVKLWIWK